MKRCNFIRAPLLFGGGASGAVPSSSMPLARAISLLSSSRSLLLSGTSSSTNTSSHVSSSSSSSSSPPQSVTRREVRQRLLSNRSPHHYGMSSSSISSSSSSSGIAFTTGILNSCQSKSMYSSSSSSSRSRSSSTFSSCSHHHHLLLLNAKRCYVTSATSKLLARGRGGDEKPPAEGGKQQQQQNNALQGVFSIREWKEEEKYKGDGERGPEEDPFGQNAEQGYMPFPPPFHTLNIVMLLFLANILFYGVMNFVNNDDMRDFIVEHFTLSHENWWKVYPLFTNSLYQEQLLQLVIDCWLLNQFGNSVLGFLGGSRLLVFWAMTCLGGGLLHVGRQYFELYYGIDPLEVRGRCYGPNPFILGLVGVEGLIFRHLNFMQQPPMPFLVMTAMVMIIDVWRIFTTKPEEHGAPTGGALVAYIFWALPTRFLGLSKLTAAL